jgi:hypothetical protein
LTKKNTNDIAACHQDAVKDAGKGCRERMQGKDPSKENKMLPIEKKSNPKRARFQGRRKEDPYSNQKGKQLTSSRK